MKQEPISWPRTRLTKPAKTAEEARLEDAREQGAPWRQWGPYLSECQWGTVREDYGKDGDAWNYFSHDQAGNRQIDAGVASLNP